MKKTTSKKMTYTINHEDKLIVLTKDFHKRSSNPMSREFEELARLHKVYADYEITLRTAVVSSSKKTHKNLTEEMMKRYMNQLPNSEEVLAEYERAKAYYGKEVEDKKNPGKKIIKAPYGKMKSWFLKKFPNYQDVDFVNVA